MDKCPPAEACRDAFDRMAKATVSMCVSTTGFGIRAPLLDVPKPNHIRNPPSHSQSPSIHSTPTHLATQQQQAVQQQLQPSYFTGQNDYGQVRAQRPRPQFDMNLRDLFPDDTVERQSFRSVNWGATPHQQVQQQMPRPQQGSMQYQPSIRSSASPVPNFASPTLSQSIMPAQQIGTPSTRTPTFSGFPAAQSAVGNSYPTSDPMSFDSYAYRNVDIDTLLADSTAAYTGQTGMSLGFDTEHDWNDGSGPDLFEGFWFRGWNGVGGGMGMGNEDGEDGADDGMA